jgi:hypothetical protein
MPVKARSKRRTTGIIVVTSAAPLRWRHTLPTENRSRLHGTPIQVREMSITAQIASNNTEPLESR